MEHLQNYHNQYRALTEILRHKKPCILATVLVTHGSTPQKAGSSALFGTEGLINGTVGGGLVENDVQKKAMNALRTKTSGIYRFELNDDMDEENSVICGGKMAILMDASPENHREVFEAVNQAFDDRISGVLVTFAQQVKKEEYNLQRMWITGANWNKAASQLPVEVIRNLEEMLEQTTPNDFRELNLTSKDKPEMIFAFLESIVPLPRLLIAGAGHVGKALAHLGKLLDFEVIVWDDRAEFANEKNLPDADLLLTGELKTIFEKINPTRDTFIVIVTRGHKQDALVLKHVIHSQAGYIGMIGSKKKVAQVRDQFIASGWTTEERWNKIHAPVGLDIQSKTVQEIAVSIAAELIQERRKLNCKNG